MAIVSYKKVRPPPMVNSDSAATNDILGVHEA